MYTLALGCSWTDAAYYSSQHLDLDCSWDKWPAHVGKILDVEIVNRGRSGSGNGYAFQELMKYISSDNPPDRVIWQLSGWTRVQLGDRRLIPGQTMGASRYDALRRGHQAAYLMGLSNLPLALDGPMPLLRQTLSLILQAIRLCRKLGIKIHIFQSDPNPIAWEGDYFLGYLNTVKAEDPETHKQFMALVDDRIYNLETTPKHFRKLIAEEDFQTINEMDPEELYGWPIFHELDGKRILSHSRISEEDGHPSAQGQKNIAAGVLKWIN